jgi:CubicO group peptidase (beta-lactamase class C family)
MQLMMTDLEKKPFADIMQANVLDPLGMKNSTFENPLPSAYHQLAATGYRSNGEEVEGKWPIYPEMAAAGLWTSPSQLILWAKDIQHTLQAQSDGLLKVATVNTMLTPGMNDYGLGPSTNEHSFGHGGADEGFRAILTAWKELQVAIVIMVNSDNGSIMQEILLSVAKEYDLAGVEPSTRTVTEKSIAVRKPMEGKYSFPLLGGAQVLIQDRGLQVTGDFLDGSIYLLPETDSTYFDKLNGTYFTFIMDGAAVTGMKVKQYEGAKIE